VTRKPVAHGGRERSQVGAVLGEQAEAVGHPAMLTPSTNSAPLATLVQTLPNAGRRRNSPWSHLFCRRLPIEAAWSR
jgi:hypothetical protein